MKIVIDIPDNFYEGAKLLENVEGATIQLPLECIVNGTVLPKNHGRLIDADAYRKEMLNSREFDFFKRLDMQPTIIEADTESEDKECLNFCMVIV